MDQNCFLKGFLTGKALKKRSSAPSLAASGSTGSGSGAYDRASFLAGLAAGMASAGAGGRSGGPASGGVTCYMPDVLLDLYISAAYRNGQLPAIYGMKELTAWARARDIHTRAEFYAWCRSNSAKEGYSDSDARSLAAGFYTTAWTDRSKYADKTAPWVYGAGWGMHNGYDWLTDKNDSGEKAQQAEHPFADITFAQKDWEVTVTYTATSAAAAAAHGWNMTSNGTGSDPAYVKQSAALVPGTYRFTYAGETMSQEMALRSQRARIKCELHSPLGEVTELGILEAGQSVTFTVPEGFLGSWYFYARVRYLPVGTQLRLTAGAAYVQTITMDLTITEHWPAQEPDPIRVTDLARAMDRLGRYRVLGREGLLLPFALVDEDRGTVQGAPQLVGEIPVKDGATTWNSSSVTFSAVPAETVVCVSGKGVPVPIEKITYTLNFTGNGAVGFVKTGSLQEGQDEKDETSFGISGTIKGGT